MKRFDSALKEAKEALHLPSSLQRMPVVIDALKTALEALVRESEDAIVLATEAGYERGYNEGYRDAKFSLL